MEEVSSSLNVLHLDTGLPVLHGKMPDSTSSVSTWLSCQDALCLGHNSEKRAFQHLHFQKFLGVI